MALSCLLRSLSSSRAKSFLGDRDRLLEGECLCGLLLLYGDLALSLPGDLLGDLDLRLLGDLDLRLGDDRFCERLYSGDLLCWTLLSASPNDTSPSGMCLGLLGSSLSGSGSGSSSSSSSSWYPGA